MSEQFQAPQKVSRYRTCSEGDVIRDEWIAYARWMGDETTYVLCPKCIGWHPMEDEDVR